MNTETHATAPEDTDPDLPKCHEVHTDPHSKNVAQQAIPNGIKAKPSAQKSPAQWAYERIILYLKNFEEQLDQEQEVAMGFTGGDVGILRIEGMGYFDPDIVTFYGKDASGGRTQLIQHVSQLNVMLRSLPKPKEHAEPNRIGFRLAQDLETES